MITYPNCKINIGLKVLRKRRDGYHALESIFFPVPWHDALEIIENKEHNAPKYILTCSGLEVQGKPENNLCVKAYQLLDEQFGLPPVKIHLHKNIPMGAGLGGGSSDGTFALKMLNELFQLKLNKTQLKKYAAALGSDCPFFVENKPAFVTGRGEKMKAIPFELSGLYLVIVHPNIHIGTAEAFSHITFSDSNFDLSKLTNLKAKSRNRHVKNDFESYAFKKHPLLAKIKTTMIEKGAIYAAMSGSGSAMFGLFKSPIKIQKSWQKYLVFQHQF